MPYEAQQSSGFGLPIHVGATVGLSLPRRFLGPRTLRCVVQRILEEPSFKRRAGELAEWGRRNNGPDTAAMLVERFASL